eukprot:4317282-Pyramimonas_sp.AAC.1
MPTITKRTPTSQPPRHHMSSLPRHAIAVWAQHSVRLHTAQDCTQSERPKVSNSWVTKVLEKHGKLWVECDRLVPAFAKVVKKDFRM